MWLRKCSTFSWLIFAPLLAAFQACNGRSCEKNWICNSSEYCVEETSIGNKEIPKFVSQNDCRLSCGKYGAIWPQPTGECHLSHGRIQFDPWKVRFMIAVPSSEATEFIRETNRIFVSNILKECSRNCTLTKNQVVLVKISVKSSSLSLDWETDESYTLTIATKGTATYVDIKSSTVFGSRHGLETLSNLITGSEDGYLILVQDAHINDKPKYCHRGLLIDTSRNYIPVRYIKNALDAMATSKLNVFHWHVIDTHSFPLEVSRVPELQRFGAYSRQQTYSRIDTQNIVKYAKYRGIRVLIELDGPSHAGNGWQWGPMAGLGNLAVCINNKPWRQYCIQPPCGQLNPVNENMYRILKDVFKDIAEVIGPEETLHMGGDEVYIPCWNSTPEIVQKMIDTGYDTSEGSFLKLWSEFHAQNLKSWDEVNRLQNPNLLTPKPVIVWSSHLTDPEFIQKYLPSDRFIIQTWNKSDSNANNDLLVKGYRIIVSTVDAWYLDHGFWGDTRYHNWQKVYSNRMIDNRLVLGGEVCMWTEYVDENNLESRVWPRAGAAAERLWSDPTTSPILVEPRFYRYRERLIARGIQPEAISPMWCRLNENICP